MLWLGIDDPQLTDSHTFETVADLRSWIIRLGRGVVIVWTNELLSDRSLAITVAVAAGVRLPQGV
jgi:hypothetical protein